LFFSI
jgi:protein bicaudal D